MGGGYLKGASIFPVEFGPSDFENDAPLELDLDLEELAMGMLGSETSSRFEEVRQMGKLFY